MTATDDDRSGDETAGGRAWFERVARGYLYLLSEMPDAPLDAIALGEWTLRDLLGHTSRAFRTIETYLAARPDPDAPIIANPAEYLRTVTAVSVGNQPLIAQRGRDAGAQLGDDAVGATRELADRVLALVAETPDDATVATPWGVMRLGHYLSTRAFELTVHGMDVARAVGMEVPDALASEASNVLNLLFATATNEQAVTVVLALTGREELPEGYSIVS